MTVQFLKWLSSGLSVGAVGAAIAFVISAFQFLSIRKRESRQREFENYHLLIERLVAPDEKSGKIFIDRQIASAFELRNFPRYYECTERILSGLLQAWGGKEAYSRLTREVELTLEFVRKRL